jgi:predicted HicB family RNase H-like nuclease
MRQTEEDFRAYTIQELFNEIINLEGGDLWDGMSSKGQKEETGMAKKVFGEKMKELGVEWE